MNAIPELDKSWETCHEGWFNFVCQKGEAICEPAFASEYDACQYWDEEFDMYIEESIADLMTTHTTINDYIVDAPEEYSAAVYGDNTDPLPDSNDDESERQADYFQEIYGSEED